MALITTGSFDDFGVNFTAPVVSRNPVLKDLRSLSVLREAARAVQREALELPQSSEARGLAIAAVTLNEGFEGVMQGVFNTTNELYFSALAWDLSGAPVVEYPGAGSDKDSCIIRLKVGKLRQFMGSGIALFPARKVTAGLTARIQLWESDAGARDFGKTMEDIAGTVKTSDLNNLLTLVSTAAGVTLATLELIKEASMELTHIVGKILQANSDDYVDFFEGYFPISVPWVPGTVAYKGCSSELQLTMFV